MPEICEWTWSRGRPRLSATTVDTSSLLLLLGAGFLLAATVITIIAFLRAPIGRETEQGFVEEPSTPRQKAAEAETTPETIWG
jgi:hypothetical protein